MVSMNGGSLNVRVTAAKVAAAIRRPVTVSPVASIYKQTTVKPVSSSTSVQTAIKPITTLGGQTSHVTAGLSTPGSVQLGALDRPVTVGLGGVSGTGSGSIMLYGIIALIVVGLVLIFKS